MLFADVGDLYLDVLMVVSVANLQAYTFTLPSLTISGVGQSEKLLKS